MKVLKSKVNKVFIIGTDDRSVTEIASALTKSGFEVMTASGESTALKTARESSPDAIVVRDNPPRLDGFMLCEQIYHRFALPLILLGNRSETQVYSQALGSPPDWDYYMRLPIDYNELAGRIKVLLWRYGKGEKPWLSERVENPLSLTAVNGYK